ncbi:MAG: PEP-CTERM sorting domain-containing protein [Gemmatimonas sp.]
MKKVAAIAAALLAFSARAEAQVNISFDEFVAPCSFQETTSLTNAYAAQGVTFSGNGSVLDQCGNFPTGAAHSGRQFLAYNGAVAPVVGAAQFATAQTSLSMWVGSTSTYSFGLYLGADLVTTLSNNSPLDPSVWTQVTSNLTFDRITIGNTSGVLQIDDLSTGAATVVTPEPASLVLTAAGLLAVGVGARRRRKA